MGRGKKRMGSGATTLTRQLAATKAKLFEYPNGTREWRLNGELHREDGPAIEWANGRRDWYRNGEFHRDDGPAIERANGTRIWYQNGERHREDGPAVEDADGTRAWWLGGEELSEAVWAGRVSERQLAAVVVRPGVRARRSPLAA